MAVENGMHMSVDIADCRKSSIYCYFQTELGALYLSPRWKFYDLCG
jgi:hypothetical protein